MRFTFLHQSAFWVEHRGTSVLVDPWLMGTCYEGGWALLPEPDAMVEKLPAKPTWIAYTHEHPDHFHVPTLRALAARFGNDLRILVPRLMIDRMTKGLAKLGFPNVVEVPLGRPFRLGPDFTIETHAVRADDSVQILRAGARTIVNANDCRIEGALLRHLVKRAPSPDFYLGQYSLADGYPYTFDGVSDEEAREAARRPLERFVRQSAAFAPKHKVPIASFVRFAMADNAHVNRWATTLDDVRARLADDAALTPMYPGDSWSEERGFERDPANRARYDRAVADLRAGTVAPAPREVVPPREEIEREAAARFADMFRKIPRRLRARIGALGFHLDDAARSCVVDWRTSEVRWIDGEPKDVPYFRLGAGYFLKVCRSPWGWSNLHIGCRFAVHAWRGTRAVQAFLPASILYGLGYFDRGLLGLVRMRSVAAAWRRRVEIFDLARKAVFGRVWTRGAFERL